MMKMIVWMSCLLVGMLSDRVVAFNSPDVYYFCSSRPGTQGVAEGKSHVWYTRIKQMPIRQEELIKRLTNDWGTKINLQCKNSKGCTSDLNVYDTESAAVQNLEAFKNKYADTTLFILSEMEFK